MKTLEFLSNSTDQTRRIAADIINELGRNVTFGLHGELGAGKTCFVQGLALALNISGPVTSPTFNIVNEYKGATPLYHIDLYRLTSESDMISFDLETYLDNYGVKAIEWAERASTLLPESTVNIVFELDEKPESRRISVAIPI